MTLGIAMALLMIQKGMVLIRLSRSEYFPIIINISAINIDVTSMGINAPRNDLFISLIFDLLKLSSKEPSSTMRMSPMVPNTGNRIEKSGS